MNYAGDFSPTQTYRLLADDPDAVLVDVRTEAEWSYVGLPDLSALGRTVVRVEWVRFPDGARNEDFIGQLHSAGLRTDQLIAFLCRSGVRSVAAASAATEAGFTRAHNIAEGFEGPLDETGHRGTASGWKAQGLPWRQS